MHLIKNKKSLFFILCFSLNCLAAEMSPGARNTGLKYLGSSVSGTLLTLTTLIGASTALSLLSSDQPNHKLYGVATGIATAGIYWNTSKKINDSKKQRYRQLRDHHQIDPEERKGIKKASRGLGCLLIFGFLGAVAEISKRNNSHVPTTTKFQDMTAGHKFDNFLILGCGGALGYKAYRYYKKYGWPLL